MKKYRTFTLLELLCCIVIVSVMLIIAIPSMKVVIDNSRLNSMKSSAILVLDLAEKKYTESMLLDENKNREETTAKTLSEISNTIKESSMTSKELSETNRLLVDKMTYELQSIDSSISQMNGDLKKIADKLDKED